MCPENESETAIKSRYNILIADDEVGIRYYLCKIVKGCGFCVETAEDGNQALEKIKKIKFDALVLDVTMPGISGIQIYNWLKTGAATKNIPVIFCTAFTFEELKAQIDGPDWYYLAKPFTGEDLCRKLYQILGC